MSSKLRDALNQLLGLIDNEILVFNDSIETSEFHKTIIVGGLSWEDVVKMQQPKDKKAR